MTLNPHISVIVPSYNHRRFLPMRMETILNQTRQDFELILLDDASPDGSGEFLETFLHHPRVRVIRNDANTGSPFVQWNRGLSEARGELIWIAESDDVASLQFLEVLAGILDRDQSIGLAFCCSQRIDEEGTVLSETTAHPENTIWQCDFQMKGPPFVSGPLYFSNLIVSASAVVFRRHLYEMVGPAPTEFRLAGDWLQWCRMLLISDVYYVAQVLSATRIHTNTRRHGTASSGTLELESLGVQHQIRSGVNVDRSRIREGAEKVAISWLQSMRAGRFSGSVFRHPLFLWKLFATDFATGCFFAINWPYAFAVWVVKRFIVPSRGPVC